ncbi:hypothetical protein [Natronobiforma cellulositropha]|uniref:hypothetical protein n=1 Tax=Natronobiforma cellulositropha TaxID=1679076 RepID=UPI0021D5FDD0|nr:hypothetical protein [Natronobiforma cellulositropha]
MNADILGEDDDDIGLEVTDNNGGVHHIELHKDGGEIYAHHCEAYADKAAERTSEENEHNNQARRFAKYYVFTQRGYDTLEHAQNPAYIDAVRRAIAALSDEAFERYFGALYQQLRSHDADVERPVPLPAGVRAPDAVVYELEVYLGLDLEGEVAERAQALAGEAGLDLSEGSDVRPVSALSAGDLERWRAVGEELVEVVERDGLEADLTVAAVSGIHVGYPNARGCHEVERAETPLEREPDTKIELLPHAPETLVEFREALDHHLRCQVRDRFVTMGLVPPEPFRVIGFGTLHDARRYDHYDLYPQLHLRDGDEGTLFS